MRRTLLLGLRGTRAELTAQLPPALGFVAGALREGFPGEASATLEDVSAEDVRAVLDWGRQRVAGRTRVRVARLYEDRGREDLGASPVVELEGGPLEPVEVTDLARSLAGWWDCTHCDRVRLEQVGPLEPALDEVDPPRDVLLTEQRHLLVAAHLRPVLEPLGAAFRPLRGTEDYLQVDVPVRVPLLEEFPVVGVGEACPGCGRRDHDRSDVVEGPLELGGDGTELAVRGTWPLPLALDAPFAGPFAQVATPLSGRVWVSEAPRHRVGEPVDLAREPAWRGQGRHLLLARSEAVAALLDAGASGVLFQPVRMRAAPVP